MKKIIFIFTFLLVGFAQAASECTVYVNEEYPKNLQESFSSILEDKGFEVVPKIEQSSLYLSVVPIGFSDGPCGDFDLASYTYEAKLKSSIDHSVQESAMYKDVAQNGRCAVRLLAMEGAVKKLSDCR
jgi:hypothetical protein